jgi:hypothetical protein
MMDQGKHLEWEGKYHSSKKKIYMIVTWGLHCY